MSLAAASTSASPQAALCARILRSRPRSTATADRPARPWSRPCGTRRGGLTAVEITYLDQHGQRSAGARPARKIVGVLPAGCAVRLAPSAEAMVVGEGVFTTLSAMRRFALPGWAFLSTSNLRRWTAPGSVRGVIIGADRGPEGERSAAKLQAALASGECAAEIALPPQG